MEECYEVLLDREPAGKVTLSRQGLYCRVICRCRVPGDRVFRLWAQTDRGRENLGVVVPEGEGFFLDRKIPAKRLGTGKPQFLLSASPEQSRGQFVPISPEEPFLYIDRLKTAFLETRQGKVGICTDVNPEAF